MKYTVQELAEKIGGRVLGDGAKVISDTSSLETGKSHTIAFAVGDYAAHLGEAEAGAVIVEDDNLKGPMPLIVVSNAKKAFSEVLELYHPPIHIEPGIHETALIGKDVTIGNNVSIGAYAVVSDHCDIGDNVIIYPQVFVGHNVTIGADSCIYPQSVIHGNCQLGERVVLRANAVIGGEGFGFATENGKHTHIPQVGNVILEDDVEIGSCSCVDNGTLGATIIRRGTKIDNLVHIAHNVEIGEDCFLVAQVGIAGSTKCGHHNIFAGQVGCTGHITIGNNCTFYARTGITGHVPSDVQYAGFPMKPHREWLKSEAYVSRLPKMAQQVKSLEKEVEALKELLKEKL